MFVGADINQADDETVDDQADVQTADDETVQPAAAVLTVATAVDQAHAAAPWPPWRRPVFRPRALRLEPDECTEPEWPETDACEAEAAADEAAESEEELSEPEVQECWIPTDPEELRRFKDNIMCNNMFCGYLQHSDPSVCADDYCCRLCGEYDERGPSKKHYTNHGRWCEHRELDEDNVQLLKEGWEAASSSKGLK